MHSTYFYFPSLSIPSSYKSLSVWYLWKLEALDPLVGDTCQLPDLSVGTKHGNSEKTICILNH